MSSQTPPLPPRLAATLRRFESLGREEKMAALVSYARKLEPLPERLQGLPDDGHTVPECQTPLRLFSEFTDGKLHFHAEINARQSPTVAAFLSIVFAAVNDEPPATTLAIPPDFVRVVMKSMGLGTREVGLEAIVNRLKHHARQASATS